MSAKRFVESMENVDEVREILLDKLIIKKWTRMKCMYGCSFYGKSMSCPPEVPPIEECIKMVEEYVTALFIKFKDKDMEKCNKTILEIEATLFRKGYYKAFGFFVTPCRERNRVKCRPTAEAFGIDIIATAKNVGIGIDKKPGEGFAPLGVVLVE